MKAESWDTVTLVDRTDYYRVYTYRGKRIYAGMNSDTVCDDETDTVDSIIKPEKKK